MVAVSVLMMTAALWNFGLALRQNWCASARHDLEVAVQLCVHAPSIVLVIG